MKFRRLSRALLGSSLLLSATAVTGLSVGLVSPAQAALPTSVSRIKALNPNGNSAPPGPFQGGIDSSKHVASFKSKVFFAANDGTKGTELWVTDGTAAGTSLLLDINTGSGSSNPTLLTPGTNKMFFTADNGTNGRELWVTDGSTSGTKMVKDINPSGIASGWPGHPKGSVEEADQLTVIDDVAYFAASDGTNGFEPWKSDGTDSGTQMLSNINTSGDSMAAPNDTTIASAKNLFTRSFFKLGTSIFFAAYAPANGRELYKYSASTVSRITELNTTITKNSVISSEPEGDITAAIVGSKLLFAGTKNGYEANSDGNRLALYSVEESSSSATLVSEVQVNDLKTLNSTTVLVSGHKWSAPGNLTLDTTVGMELYKTDGSVGNLTLVKDIWTGVNGNFASGSTPGQFTLLNDQMYFVAADATAGRELWRTDGTGAGTVLIKDFIAGVGDGFGSSSNRELIYTNPSAGVVAVAAATQYYGPQNIWVGDNSTVGMTKIEGATASIPLAPIGDAFFFFGSANGSSPDSEPWITRPSSDSTLSMLSARISLATPTPLPLTPTFDPSVLEYSINVTAADTPIAIAFTTSNSSATVKVDGKTETTQVFRTIIDPVFVEIEVTAVDGVTKSKYEIAVAVNGVAPTTTTTSTTVAPEEPGSGSSGGDSSEGGNTATSTPTSAVATTVLASTNAPPTTAPANIYANAVPGVTVTDTRTYQTAPRKVAGDSAIDVLTPAQNRVMDVVSKTPSVCLPSDDDLVFIDDGRCIAEVVNTKTRAVLRVLRTTVVEDEVSELKVGNEVAVLTPLYFVAGSFDFKPESLSRLGRLKNKITAAGSVLVAGHSGILLGNTPENIELARQRALVTVKELRARGAKGPFSIASVGALDPETTVKTQEAQDRNRRSVIVLIP